MQENLEIDKIYARHILTAIEQVKPRITKEMLQFYDNFGAKSGVK